MRGRRIFLRCRRAQMSQRRDCMCCIRRVTEAMNRRENSRCRSVARRHSARRNAENPQPLSIRPCDIAQFVGGAEPADDLTLLALRWTGLAHVISTRGSRGSETPSAVGSKARVCRASGQDPLSRKYPFRQGSTHALGPLKRNASLDGLRADQVGVTNNGNVRRRLRAISASKRLTSCFDSSVNLRCRSRNKG